MDKTGTENMKDTIKSLHNECLIEDPKYVDI